jgi:1,4-alpha-glucan branching enzyme
MGGEFGQRREWQHEESLEWHVLQYPLHAGVRQWMRDLNAFYKQTPAMYQRDFTPDGFEWVDCNDSENSTLAFLRKGHSPDDMVLVICNFTPVPRDNFHIGVPRGGPWRERLNSDAREYGGGGIGNFGVVDSAPLPSHGRNHSLTLRLPPLATLLLTPA